MEKLMLEFNCGVRYSLIVRRLTDQTPTVFDR
jgi:hypothetical protein